MIFNIKSNDNSILLFNFKIFIFNELYEKNQSALNNFYLHNLLISVADSSYGLKNSMISLIMIALILFFIRKINNSRKLLLLKNLSNGITKVYSIIIVLAVIFGNPKFSAQANCNSFPKIFGGSGYGTYLYHIDIFADYFAMVGAIYDSSLTGLSSE